MLILGLIFGLVAATFAGVTGARTREGAYKMGTAIRYTYNLAAINNRVYALTIDLDANTYKAGPLEPRGKCDRLLLAMDGGDTDPVIMRYGDTGDPDDRDDDDDDEPKPAAVSTTGDGEVKVPSWSSEDGTPAGKLTRMLSGEVRDEAAEDARKVGVVSEDGAKAHDKKQFKTFRKNQMAKPKKLPKGVRFGGVVLRDGADPVTEGVVHILFYPHGFSQRALIYVESGDEEEPDTFTVEILSLQGRGKVHGERLAPSEFKEKTE